MVFGAVSLAILSTAFTALYWNRFLAPSAGATFFYLAEQMLQGRLPYRDLFLVVTPLDVFKIAALIHLFGDYIFVARLEAAIERTILALLLYFLLTQFCRASSAMLASFLTVVVLAADPADGMLHYHTDSVFWAVAAAGCCAIWLRKDSPRTKIAAATFAGFFAALSILTNQTTGAGLIGAVAVAGSLLAWRSNGIHGILSFIVPLFAGWLVPIAVFVGWLAKTGSLTPFLHTMVTANTSKGSLLIVLTRPVIQRPSLFVAAAVAAPVLARIVRRSPKRDTPERFSAIAMIAAAGAVTLALTVASVYSGAWWPGSLGPLPALYSRLATAVLGRAESLTFMFALTGSAFLFFDYGWRCLNRGLTRGEEQIWLLSAISFATAYMLSLSWAAFSPMAAPGVALLAGLALDRLQGAGGRRFAALSAVVLLIVYGSAGGKLMSPFNWMYWREPSVKEAHYSSSLTKLAGLRISQPALSLTETITRLVQQHTRPGDSLLVYPYFPIFYVLTGLNPPTYAFNHYIDVCPDSVCLQDAAALRIHPPDAIVYLIQTPEDLRRDEATFRSGAASGSRAVARTIEDLARGYHKLLSAAVPGDRHTIEVYTRE